MNREGASLPGRWVASSHVNVAGGETGSREYQLPLAYKGGQKDAAQPEAANSIVVRYD